MGKTSINVIKEKIIEITKAFSKQRLVRILVDIFLWEEETLLECVRMNFLINHAVNFMTAFLLT